MLVLGAGGDDGSGGVTVGYALHSCRGRRTETNRLHTRPRCSLLGHCPVCLALSFPFLPSPPLSLSLSFSLSRLLLVSFSLPFPFLFVLFSFPPPPSPPPSSSSTTTTTTMAMALSANLLTREKHFLVPLLLHFPGRSSRGGTLPSVSCDAESS